MTWQALHSHMHEVPVWNSSAVKRPVEPEPARSPASAPAHSTHSPVSCTRVNDTVRSHLTHRRT